MKSEVTLLTTTFYQPGELRLELACELISLACADGHNVFIVDGSSDEVSTRLVDAGANVFRQKGRGMLASRQEVFAHAAEYWMWRSEPPNPNHLIGFWTEEKPDLVRSIPEIIKPIVDGNADISIPFRDESVWASYPWFQATTEQTANRIYWRETGLRADPMFGPVAFNLSLAGRFAECDPEIEFGVSGSYLQHAAVLKLHANGARVASPVVDFIYPPRQKAEEEGEKAEAMFRKRIAQLHELSLNVYPKLAEALGLGPHAKLPLK